LLAQLPDLKELKGFKKIALKKGQTETVTFTLSVEDLKFYNYDIDFVAEPGDFEVFVGASSVENLKSEFELTK
jgi:beta-glucosidase